MYVFLIYFSLPPLNKKEISSVHIYDASGRLLKRKRTLNQRSSNIRLIRKI